MDACKKKKKSGGMSVSCPLIDDFRADSPDNPEHGAPIHGEMKGRITDTSIVCVALGGVPWHQLMCACINPPFSVLNPVHSVFNLHYEYSSPAPLL